METFLCVLLAVVLLVVAIAASACSEMADSNCRSAEFLDKARKLKATK